MRIIGDMILAGLGSLKNARIENLAADPGNPSVGQIWFNSTAGTYKGFDGTAVFTFSTGGSATAIQSELDATQASIGLTEAGALDAFTGSNFLASASTLRAAVLALDAAGGATNTKLTDALLGAGLGTTGGYTPPTGSTYLGATTSIVDGLDALDTQLGTQATALSAAGTEVDAIETAVGLNSDGTFNPFSGTNYLNGATGIKNGMGLLDTQAKANADAIAINTTDITSKVSKAGDSMTGNLSMGGTFTITNLTAPTANDHAATKLYVDSAISGLKWKDPVVAAADSNIVLSGLLTIDGKALVANARVLVMGQTDASENGIYLAKVGAWVRSDDFDQTTPVNEINEAAMLVTGGNTYAGFAFTQTDTVTTLDTDTITFVQFNGAATMTAGTGLAQTGNTLNVNLGAGINEGPTDEVGIDLYSAATSALILTTDGAARSTSGASQLALLLDGSGLEQSASGLKIAAGGVGITEINAAVAGAGLAGGGGNALSVLVDDTSIGINVDTLEIKALGVTNAMLAGSIANDKLLNSAIVVAASAGDTSDSIDLGSTLNLLGGTGINTTLDAATNSITFALNATLDNLTDVSVAAASTGQSLVYTGSAWEAKSTVYEFDGTSAAAASHIVTHGLGKKFCNVTVYDSTDKVIIPDSITADTSNQLTITFSSAITCRAVIG